jgi:hypothetical protein
VRLLLGDAHPDYRRRCKQVFLAVLQEDAAHLPTIAEDIQALRRQIEAL